MLISRSAYQQNLLKRMTYPLRTPDTVEATSAASWPWLLAFLGGISHKPLPRPDPRDHKTVAFVSTPRGRMRGFRAAKIIDLFEIACYDKALGTVSRQTRCARCRGYIKVPAGGLP